jgi:hypothetical protein
MFEDGGTRMLAELYYTPVAESLKKAGEKLGNYLHAAKKYRLPDDPWWATFRQLLDEATAGLLRATRGTLLGLPLISTEGKSAMYVEEDLPFRSRRLSSKNES